MSKFFERFTSAALIVALSFSLFFSVPVNKWKVEKAYANPAVAVPVVVATALIASGVLIAGASEAEYNANLNAIVADLEDMAEEAGTTVDAMCQSAINPDGTINLQALNNSGFFGLLPALYQHLYDEQAAVEGTLSSVPNRSTYWIAGTEYNTFAGEVSAMSMAPDAIATASNNGARQLVFYTYNPNFRHYEFWYANQNPVLIKPLTGSNSGFQCVNASGSPITLYYARIAVTKNGAFDSSKTSNGAGTCHAGVSAGISYYLNRDAHLKIWNEDTIPAPASTAGDTVAVFDPEIVAGTWTAPTDTVEPFVPTAAMIDVGYSKSDVTIADVSGQIDDANTNLNQIKTGIDALDLLLNSLLAVVQGIATNVSNIWGVMSDIASGPFAWLQAWWNTLTGWWNTLISWIGNTPIGTLFANAINTIDGAINGLPLSDILSGVNSIPGAIETGIGTFTGTLEGILEGVLDIPSDLAGVADAVISIPAEIAAVLDGILAGEAEGALQPGSGGLNISEELKAQLNLMLETKAPFCYLKRFGNVANTVSGNFSADPSFYFDIDIPFAGTQRFDAGQILNQQWGSLTVAGYIRLMLTSVMSAGMLAVSVRLAMGAIKSKE